MTALIFALLTFLATGRQTPGPPPVPTFNKDVAPILYANCVTCHRPNEVAPFSLLTYADVQPRARRIVEATSKRIMPPWKPEHGFGIFANERRLTDEQIAIVKRWADAGAPEGDPKDTPVPPVFAEGWLAGKPDLVVTPKAPHVVMAMGHDDFQCFVLPLGLDRDAYLGGMEFRPGNHRVVHHALVFVDTTGAARALAGADGSYPCFGGPGVRDVSMIGGWAPGAVAAPKTQEFSRPLPKGADLVVQIHYHPSGRQEQDQFSLGLSFSGPPTRGVATMMLFNTRIDIAPGDSHYVVKQSLTLPRDAELLGIAPHAHYLCRQMTVIAHPPGAEAIPLIRINDWDFHWQGGYRFAAPIAVPKGTRIEFEYVYDNSSDNPRNPAKPPVRVKWGEQTMDEMAVAFVTVALPTPADVEPFRQELAKEYFGMLFAEGSRLDQLPNDLSAQQRQGLTTAFTLFDRDKDGTLSAEEAAALVAFLKSRR